MQAEQSLKTGDLAASLDELQGEVRKDPSNAASRIFLFQLLCVLGEWKRALTQLNVIGELDAGALPMVQTYREAIQCEVLRAEIFAGKRTPLVFGEPESWVAGVLQALEMGAKGNHAEAQALRERSFEDAPATSGSVDGEGFEWIADADSRLGPILEAVVNGRYYWIPFHRIQHITIEEPSDLRDMVWTPAFFTWANGGEGVGLIPTRYAGSETDEDNLIRLARKTTWSEPAENVYYGLGQRLFATDEGDKPLLDVRQIALDTGDDAGDETDAPDTPGTEGSPDG